MDTSACSAAMRAAAAAGVRPATASSPMTSVLGEGELGRGNKRQGENSSKSRFEQSGFSHFSTLHETTVRLPGAGKRLLFEWSYLIGISF
jgi:hypothetical protein